MIAEFLADLRERIKRGAAATLTRDEFDPAVSQDTLLFVIVAYVVVSGVILLVGLPMVALFGRAAGVAYWALSVPILAFIGTVLISWEAMRYWFGRRDARGADPRDASGFTSRTKNLRDVAMTVVSIVLGIIALVVVTQAIGMLL